MRLLNLGFCLVFLALASCGGKVTADASADATDAVGDAQADAAAADIAADATVTAPPKGYTAAFRATLANKAPAEFAAGEIVFFEALWGTETFNELPPADFLVQLWKSDTAKWGKQFSNYGFLTDPGDDLPIGLKRGQQDPTQARENCSTCHVAQLPDGRYWAGAPNTKLQWGKFQADVHAAWVAAGHAALATDAAIKTMRATPPGCAFLDGDGVTVEVANDFPLYCDLHKMNHLNLLGSGNDLKTEVYLSLHSFVTPLPFPSDADDLVHYFQFLDAPLPPTPTDAAAVTRGRQVFVTARCNSCHHDDIGQNTSVELVDANEKMPGDDSAHPNGTIATEKLFLTAATSGLNLPGGSTGGPGPGLADLLQFIVDNGLSIANPNGYVASNLHALWATAPYLHNGSVPTLKDLLTPVANRPKSFTRESFTFDTTFPGMSNAGHTFGTTLSDSDKSDLVAYLQSL